MKKHLILLTTVILCLPIMSSAMPADENGEVCFWSDPRGNAIFTQGYNWGGGTISTLKDCELVLRANLIWLNFFKKYSGTIRFVDPAGPVTECTTAPQKYPFSKASQDFDDLMARAYKGHASPTELVPFESYIDENLQVVCP